MLDRLNRIGKLIKSFNYKSVLQLNDLELYNAVLDFLRVMDLKI